MRGLFFPRVETFKLRQKLELLRIEVMGVFEGYKREKCDKWGARRPTSANLRNVEEEDKGG